MRNPLPKRPVPFWRLFLRGWGWIAVLVVPLVLVLGGIAVSKGFVALSLALNGVESQAVVTSKRRDQADPGDRGNTRRVHYLDYTFSADGEEIAASARVSKEFSNSVRRGETLPVRYSASDPAMSEIERGFNAREAGLSALWLLGTLAVCWFVLRRHLRRVRDAIWVRDNGTPSKAEIIRHEDLKMQINGRSSYRLHWRDEAGALGSSPIVNKFALKHFPVGSEITLYVDSVAGRPPVWEGEVGPKTANR